LRCGANSTASVDLPRPAGPKIETRCGRLSFTARSQKLRRNRQLAVAARRSFAPREWPGSPAAVSARTAIHASTGRSFPLATTASVGWYSIIARGLAVGSPRRRRCRSPARLPADALSVLTTSPATIDSPSSGPRAGVTRPPSPVLTASPDLQVPAPRAHRPSPARTSAARTRALRVVAMRKRCAEEAHDRIADELLDDASRTIRSPAARGRG